ncbi:MAG: ABC transporter transmembrane domain-containing protein [Promethearchaeota archaeon]
MNSFQMIFKYWAKSKKDFIFQFIYLLLSTIFYTFTPIFIGRMIGSLVNVNLLLVNFLFVLGFAFLVYIFNRASRSRGAIVSSRAIYHLRTDISNAIYRQSFSFFDKTETGQLISRANGIEFRNTINSSNDRCFCGFSPF